MDEQNQMSEKNAHQFEDNEEENNNTDVVKYQHSLALKHMNGINPLGLVEEHYDSEDSTRHFKTIDGCESDAPIVLVVMGGRGSGKTTLLNSMVNHLLGVQWANQFRYKLISTENHPTVEEHDIVTGYVLGKQEGFTVSRPIIVIDTPGIEETTEDGTSSTLKKLMKYLRFKKISQIHNVLYTLPATMGRLTTEQKQNFTTLQRALPSGNNGVANASMMITHSDIGKPPAENAIVEAGFGSALCYKINNSTLYDDGVDKDEDTDGGDQDSDGSDYGDDLKAEMSRQYWRLSNNSWTKFFKNVVDVTPYDVRNFQNAGERTANQRSQQLN